MENISTASSIYEKLTYKQAAFSFNITDSFDKEYNGMLFRKIGETGAMKLPVFINLTNGAIYCEDYKMEFVNSSWGQFIQIAEEIKKFETLVDKYYTSYEIAIVKKTVGNPIDEKLFNNFILPLLKPFPIKKHSYFERFIQIVNKYTNNTNWNCLPKYAYESYKQWGKNSSLIKLLHNAHLVEHHIGCDVFNKNAQRNAEKIKKLLIQLKQKLHRIDRAAFECEDNFWSESIFGEYFDLSIIFPTLDPNPLDDVNLMDFSLPTRISILTQPFITKQDDLPF